VFRILSNRVLRDLLIGSALFWAVLGLLWFPEEAMEAAQSGVTLCLNVIIPSLFPFFVLSTLLVDLGLCNYFGRALQWIMQPLFRVNGACASALALGFIGGYPVGARTAIALYEKKLCSRVEAERMLAFCNNSGPAFILGVVGAGVFSSSRIGIFLYLAHTTASLCVGFLFRFYKAGKGGTETRLPAASFHAPRFSTAFTDSVKSAFSNTLNICAFVLFFTVLIRLLFLFGILPGISQLLGSLLAPLGCTQTGVEHLLTGFVEMTSGVWTLSDSGALAGRLSMAAFMLGWAGVSVHCQVLSFIGNSGLSVGTYVVGKLLHGTFSAIFVRLFAGFFALDAPVGSYLAEQVDDIVTISFGTALTISLVAAWAAWILFFLISAHAAQKSSRKSKHHTI
jgi:sporulation integral membrane protein YlbJ